MSVLSNYENSRLDVIYSILMNRRTVRNDIPRDYAGGKQRRGKLRKRRTHDCAVFLCRQSGSKKADHTYFATAKWQARRAS